MEPVYRGAIALSNIAVSLQGRHCYRQALQTAEDAVLLMKHACRAREQQQGELSNSANAHATAAAEDMINMKIHKALRRIAKPEPSTVTLPRAPPGCEDFSVASVSDDTIAMESTVFTLSTNQAVMIRIDEYGMDGARDVDIDSSIILHNYGICCLSQASISTPELAQRLCDIALKVLLLTQNLLSGRAELAEDIDGTDEITMQKLYFVAAVATNSMACALSLLSLGRTDANQVRECETRVESLLSALREFDAVEHRITIAAAA